MCSLVFTDFWKTAKDPYKGKDRMVSNEEGLNAAVRGFKLIQQNILISSYT